MAAASAPATATAGGAGAGATAGVPAAPPLLRSLSRGRTGTSSDTGFHLAALAAAIDELFAVDKPGDALSSLSDGGGSFDISGLQALLPSAGAPVPAAAFVADVTAALAAHPSRFVSVTTDGTRLIHYRPLARLSRVLDSLFSEEPPVPRAEKDVVSAYFDAACTASPRGCAPISLLLAHSPTLSSLAPRGVADVVDALKTHPPLFLSLGPTVNHVRPMSFDEAVMRGLDLILSRRNTNADSHVSRILVSNGGVLPFPLLLSPAFPRFVAVCQYAPSAATAAGDWTPAELLAILAGQPLPPPAPASSSDSSPVTSWSVTAAAAVPLVGGATREEAAAALRAAVLRDVTAVVTTGRSSNIALSSDGSGVVALSRLERIRRRMEHYFSDAAYARDEFLQKLAAESPGGFVPIVELAGWKGLRMLSASVPDIAAAVADSAIIEVSRNRKFVRKRGLVVTEASASTPVPDGGTAAAPVVARLARWDGDVEGLIQVLLEQFLSPAWLSIDPMLQDALYAHLDQRSGIVTIPIGVLIPLLDTIAARSHTPPYVARTIVAVKPTLLAHRASHAAASGTTLTIAAAGAGAGAGGGTSRRFLAPGAGTISLPMPDMQSRALIVARGLPFRPTGAAPRFSVMTFNLLAQCLASPEVYTYVAPEALAWEHRRHAIIAEIFTHQPSLLGLQELQATTYGWGDHTRYSADHASWVLETLQRRGYDGCYRVCQDDPRLGWHNRRWPRIGVALFWDTSVFEPLDDSSVFRISYSTAVYDACEAVPASREFLCLWQGAVAALLRHKASGAVVLAATTHISCRWQQPLLQALQVHACLGELHKFLRERDLPDVPVVLCGDFNMTPGTGTYKLVTEGRMDGASPDWRPIMTPSPSPATEDVSMSAAEATETTLPSEVTLPFSALTSPLVMASAYAAALGREPLFTNAALRGSDGTLFSATLDYIFHTPASLRVTTVLATPTMAEATQELALPSNRFPSDHVPIYAELEFTSPIVLPPPAITAASTLRVRSHRPVHWRSPRTRGHLTSATTASPASALEGGGASAGAGAGAGPAGS